MASRVVLRTLLIPAAAVVGVSNGHAKTPHCSKCTECHCKPSELPIYPVECQACKSQKVTRPPSDIEEAIGKVRKELWVWQDGVQGLRQKVVDFVDTGMAHSSSTVEFLREESNGPERAAAIGVGTLTGLIFGLRGGAFKRLSYATLGGLGMASVCYPRDAAEYSKLALEEGNRYFIAGYHFLFGEAPKVPEFLEGYLATQKEPSKEAKK